MRPPISPPSVASACRVLFDARGTRIDADGERPALRVAIDRLAGDEHESLLETAVQPTLAEGVHLFRGAGVVAGFAVADPGADLETGTADLYRRLFGALDGQHPYRLWNYVPGINAVASGLENYRRFCRARSLAFESRFGADFESLLPASSAVGSRSGPLAVAFVAGTAPGRHHENPRQVPAFQYPPEHGPRPPSFSRATVATTRDALLVFISGTAAIRGHVTVAPGDLPAQLACTLENLRVIGAVAGAGPAIGAHGAWRRRFKVYLRRRDDLAETAARLERELLRPGDEVAYLHADICRADLVVEIEATLVRPLVAVEDRAPAT